MTRSTSPVPVANLDDMRWRAVVDALYARTMAEDPRARDDARDRGFHDDAAPGFYQAMVGAFMPVTPDLGMLLYLLVRVSGARHVVEYGTSYGISTLHLAAGLRDNGGGGRAISCEIEPFKVEQARRHVHEAGLTPFVEIRCDDARAALSADLPDAIDLLLLDGAKSDYLPLLLQLESRLAPTALVIADNIAMASARPFAEHLADPANGWTTVTLTTRALGSEHPFAMALRCTR